MFRKTSFLAVAISILLVSPLFAAQVDSTWVGGSGDWETPTNWSPQLVPDNNATNTYAVTIDAGVSSTKIFLSNSHTIDLLVCRGDIRLQGSQHTYVAISLALPTGLTNYGYLDAGAWGVEWFELKGNVTNTSGGKFEFEGADISGDLVNPTGGTIKVSGDIGVTNLQNAGLVIGGTSWQKLDADISINNVGQIKLYGGGCGTEGVLDNNNTGVVTGFGTVWASELLANKGMIYATGGSLAAGVGDSLLNTGTLGNAPSASLNVMHFATPANFDNSGTILVGAGGGTAFDCNVTNEPNGIIRMFGGTLGAVKITQKPDANFTGFGGITGNVQIDPNAVVKLTGPTNVVGDVNVPAGATLEISDGQTLITGHTTCKGTIHLKGGTVIFQGGCDCNDCNIVNEAGIDRNHFDLNADGKVDLEDFDYFADSWLWEASWY